MGISIDSGDRTLVEQNAIASDAANANM